jgi:DNA adenine methylase
VIKNNQPWCRPLFRWAGSKRSLLPLLLKCVPDNYERYVEPFAGSACLFFALKPASAILGDFNSDLMQAYDVIARHPRIVARQVSCLPDTSRAYYELRSQAPESLDGIQQAVRFTYLNRHCFNGVYRTDRLNRFNVPRGDRPGLPPSEAEIYRCSVALRAATLVTGDFEAALKLARRNDFVYLDPPYSTASRPTFGEYGYGAFGRHDLSRLLESLKALSKRGARVLLSYTADAEVLGALRDWSVISIRVRRQVGGGGRNAKTSEILASNFAELDELSKECRGLTARLRQNASRRRLS